MSASGQWYHQHHQHRHLHLPPPAPPPAEKWSTSCAGEASEVLLELTQELLAALLLLVYRRTPRCGSRTGREKLGRPYAHLPLAADRHTPIRGHHPIPPHPLTPLFTPPAPLLHHQQCHRQAVNHRPHQDEGRTRRGRGGRMGSAHPEARHEPPRGQPPSPAWLLVSVAYSGWLRKELYRGARVACSRVSSCCPDPVILVTNLLYVGHESR